MSNVIVVGYDGTPGAEAALDEALRLAKDLGGSLVIAFSYEISRLGGEVKDLADALRERGEGIVQTAMEKAGAAGVEAEAVHAEGGPADVLAELAEEREARAIVVGTWGESPLKGAIVGATPHKLLQISTVPVHVTPVTPD